MSDLGGSVLLVGVFIAFAVVLRALQWWLGRDRGLAHTQQQCSPHQASRPSRPTTTAMPRATPGAAQYQPNSVLSSSPAGNTAER
ncbi:hypothetical protein AB0K15_11400 [Amycolatopsis sp. NPDC049253]|uniref:hypothetical protein n=1 Tax=Amycolatopsis sp. NPDC049253 TaxID=3155274 RepID=UPI00343BD416